MSYMSDKAKPRENPAKDRIEEAMGTKPARSSQERQQSATAKWRTVSTAPKPGVNVGKQVRVQGNTKGSNVVGRPVEIGLESKRITLPAVNGVDGKRNRGGLIEDPKAKKSK